jgi:hypothetical protein
MHKHMKRTRMHRRMLHKRKRSLISDVLVDGKFWAVVERLRLRIFRD